MSEASYKDLKLKIIIETLKKNNNHITKTAKELKVSRSTIYRCIKIDQCQTK